MTPLEVPTEELARIVSGTHHDPHRVLGPHRHEPSGRPAVTIRVLRPMAERVAVVPDGGSGEPVALTHEYGGIWVGTLETDTIPDYRLAVTYRDDLTIDSDDPYRFLPSLGEMDLHLISEGRHERLWTVLGAHHRAYGEGQHSVQGTSFAVWAPNARGVRVVGDFNFWNGRGHPMRSMGSSGVWELFVPGVGDGTCYRFEILGADGVWRQKADPMAFRAETPPANASRVFTSAYAWNDAAWLDRRASTPPHAAPMSVYEVHLGSWRRGLSYRDLAEQLTAYVRETGFTHVELLPVMEHPYGGSWGYMVSSYYAPTSRFGSPDDFRYLVDTLHQNGIGVILDWVPAHFATDDWSLPRFDGTPLYEHPDPRRGAHPEWGSLVFDYGRPEVRNFLVANALYWFDEFHVDGIRVDAVASMLYLDYSRRPGEWVPNVYGGRENLDAIAFLQELDATCYKTFPGIATIAEESTAWPGVTRPTHLGGLGFGFKWNMGWMHDSLAYMRHDPVHRSYHHNEMTFSLAYAFSENFVLPLSHDEVVHGKGSLYAKMPGDRWQKLANLRAYLAFMWAHPGKQLLFMGCEFAQESEWAEARELDWWLLDLPDHAGLKRLVGDLNAAYRAMPALWSRDNDPGAFSWIDANDATNNVFGFVREGPAGSVGAAGWVRSSSAASDGSGVPVGDGGPLVCVANFAGVPHTGYRLGLPYAGRWREVLDTDALEYAGSGVGNLGHVTATDRPWHGRPASATLTLPPLGTLWLTPDPE